MQFTSFSYFLFLPAVFIFYHATCRSSRWSWLWLLTASYLFYAGVGAPYLLGVLAAVTLLSYGCGIAMGEVKGEMGRLFFLWLGVGAICLILVGMKYLPFIILNTNRLAILSGLNIQMPAPPILVSVAVSFFVFQAIAYLFDIYWGGLESERHLGYFALSMAFFPKLLQGPIENSGDLLPQLKAPYHFNYENVKSGLLLFGWGFFKKVVIADRLGLFVDRIYGNVYAFSGFPLILATWLYAFQLYYDFSAYTDMALGSARLFNIQLTRNFNSPYFATSVADFWRRWHITFSRWILDYIFKPIQLHWRDWGTHSTALALIVTFLISGIWHGAKWGFIIWGLLHGLFLCGSLYWKPHQKRLYRWLRVERKPLLKVWQTIVTFQLISFAWIFFRADTLPDAWYVITHLFVGGWGSIESPREFYLTMSCLIFIGAVGIVAQRTAKQELSEFLEGRPLLLRWGVYYSLLFGVIMLGVFNQGYFIYYRF